MMRQNVERFEPGSDARWRAEYRQAQYEARLVGVQPDLFNAPPIEHFHRNPRRSTPQAWTPDYQVERFQDLTPEQQAQRLADDPQTPWARTTRKRLSPEEKAVMIASAANWLKVGQRIRIIAAPPLIDGSTERRAGCEGVVWRLCSSVFADHVYVNLDLVGTQRSERIAMVELCDIEPIDQ